MFRGVARTVLSVLILAVFLFSPLIHSQERVEDYERRLQEIATQIDELRIQIKRGERKKTSILSQLDKISFNKRLIKKEMSLYDIQMKKSNTELAALDKKIPELKAQLEKEKITTREIFYLPAL